MADPSRAGDDSLFFRVLLAVYFLTALAAIAGIFAAFMFPDREFPFLRELVVTVLLESAVAVLLLFKRRFLGNRLSAEAAVVRTFRLFKAVLQGATGSAFKFRLHYLSYDPKTKQLCMKAQDEPYAERDFKETLDEGLAKGLVICEAIQAKGLQSRNLDADHYRKYPQTPIRKDLKAVMAVPVGPGDSIVGVVSLDTDAPFEDLPIGKDQLEGMFMKLGEFVEEQCLGNGAPA